MAPRYSSCLAAICLVLCLAVNARAALLLTRPAGDCLSPAVATLSYNFYPKGYQVQSISSSTADSGFSTTVDFASDFSVTYRGTYKVVTNKRANETYVLYQCGTPNPLEIANTEVEVPANTKVFEVPLVSVAVTDSNAAGFLAELGLIDRVAFSSEYAYDSCLQAIHTCGNKAVSASEPYDYDDTPANDAAFNASVEEWKTASTAQASQVDAIFSSSASSNPKSIAITAFADPGVINRAEWVKFVAVFFNKEVEAEALFQTIKGDYQKLNASARAAAAEAASPTVVAWTSMFGSTISLNYATYKRQYMTDAGGELLSANDIIAAGGKKVEGAYSTINYNFNASVDAELLGFISVLRQADIIFDDSYGFGTGNLKDLATYIATYKLSAADADAIPAIKAGNVWTFNNRLSAVQDSGAVGSDWFESSVARPDLVLADFVKVITPGAAPANTPPTWLRQLPSANSNSGNLTFTGPEACSVIATGEDSELKCQRAEPARICPNAYRDCTTGELKTVTNPSDRCEALTKCPDVQQSNSTNSTNVKNAAAAPVAASARHLLLALLSVALLAALL